MLYRLGDHETAFATLAAAIDADAHSPFADHLRGVIKRQDTRR